MNFYISKRWTLYFLVELLKLHNFTGWFTFDTNFNQELPEASLFFASIILLNVFCLYCFLVFPLLKNSHANSRPVSWNTFFSVKIWSSNHMVKFKNFINSITKNRRYISIAVIEFISECLVIHLQRFVSWMDKRERESIFWVRQGDLNPRPNLSQQEVGQGRNSSHQHYSAR